MFATASSRVLPCDMQPGRLGHSETQCWGEAGQSSFSVAIRDAAGRLLARRQVERSGGRLDLGGLAGGVYFLNVSSGGRAASLKLAVRP